MYLEVPRNVSSSQDAGGCWEKDGKYGEEVVVGPLKLPEIWTTVV